MGVSPKKKPLHEAVAYEYVSRSNSYRLLITVFACLAAFLLTTAKRKNGKRVGNRSDSQLGFWDNPRNGEFSPNIVWLMSFPNSGTSYTMTSMEIGSNLSTASNYGDEVTHKDDFSLSIYPRHAEGPYWEGLSGKMGDIRPLPSKYVLVKTHCGSRCVKCPPSQYVQTLQEYTDACRNSTAREAPDRRKVNYLYPVDRVKKVIHLIRNPFHNFVARFHLESKNYEKKGEKEWTKKHPSAPEGFRQWCADLDNGYKDDEYQTFEYDMLKQVRLSPCHGEVFKYIQWHNMAFALTEKYSIPSMVLWYEDFDDKYEETFDALFSFMEFPRVQPTREFSARHDYDTYYDHLDRRRMRLLAEKISTKATWAHVGKYFSKD